MPPIPRLLDRVDTYFDQAPRSGATVEQVGPFTLFVGVQSGWSFYARPTLGQPNPSTAEQVRKLLARQHELGVPSTIEAIEQTAPTIEAACADAGLQVQRFPLLIHQRSAAVPVPDGIRIRRLESKDPAVAASQVVAHIGFSAHGSDAGRGGTVDRDQLIEERDPAVDDYLRGRIADGYTVTIVAEDESGVVATGSHNPVGDATELVGIATLPSYRRQGLGAAVTGSLVADAQRAGSNLVALSASDEATARVYSRVGFRRIGSTLAASPAG